MAQTGLFSLPAFGNLGNRRIQSQLDLSQVPALPQNPGTTTQQALLSRIEPQIQRQRTSLETQLINQGLRPGAEAYDNAIRLLGEQENDLRTQAGLQGINADMTANQQAFGQALNQGQFGNSAQEQGFGQDLSQAQLGLQRDQLGYQQFADQRGIDAANKNSTMQGLFGLGSTLGAPLLTKALGGGIAKAAGGLLGGLGGGGAAGAAGSIGSAGLGSAAGGAGIAPTALAPAAGGGLLGLGALAIPVIGGALAGGAYLAKRAYGNGADRQAADVLTGTKTGSGQHTNTGSVHDQFQQVLQMPDGPEKQAAYGQVAQQLVDFSKKGRAQYYQAQKTLRDFNQWSRGAIPALLG